MSSTLSPVVPIYPMGRPTARPYLMAGTEMTAVSSASSACEIFLFDIREDLMGKRAFTACKFHHVSLLDWKPADVTSAVHARSKLGCRLVQAHLCLA